MCPLPARAIESKCSLVFTSMHLCLLRCREQSPNSELMLPCNMLKCSFHRGSYREIGLNEGNKGCECDRICTPE